MTSSRRQARFTLRFKHSPDLVLAVLGTFFSYASSGCLSNRYVIPPQELARIARLPPETRGNRVLVVQGLGERRAEAIEPAPLATSAAPVPPAGTYPVPADSGAWADPAQAAPADAYAEEPSPEANLDAQVGVDILVTPDGSLGPTHGQSHGFNPGRSAGGSLPGRATPAPRPAGGFRPSAGGGSSFGSLPRGGGGGKDEVVVVAIIIVAVAVLAAAGLAVTEGLRYDGAVRMFAGQPVHLTDADGEERTVALGDLVPADAAQSVSAEVMDDEGWGLRVLDRRPLDRKGFAFKVDVGSLQSLGTGYSATGVGSNIQFGYFPLHSLGVLANLSLGGGSDPLGHTFQRHSVSGEVQWFPLDLWHFHLGAFGHAGMQYAKDAAANWRAGPALGGGLILEISLTTRLALMIRGDWTTARTAPDGKSWADSALITGGLAIY
jgi:hypothetical protein